MRKKTIENINKLFQINAQENSEEIFTTLKSIIDFKSGYIFYSNPKRLEYSYNSGLKYKYYLEEKLKIQNMSYGKLRITRNRKFTTGEEKIFKLCTAIISEIIKDLEITKITKMQVKTLQKGITESSRAYKSEKQKNEFFANFSHELRTPLNAIINSSELLSEKILGDLNTKQTEYVKDIKISGLLLLGMINDILDMAKFESNALKLNLSQFSAKRMLDEVCNIINPIAEKKEISIEKNIETEINITADYQKVQQILFNIITNAIKYTPECGKIVININKNEKSILISIKDNGIGIDKRYHKKIFEKFTQLNGKKDSNGLGLAITKEFVKMHKGKIRVNSELGKGAEFIIELPLVF